MCTAVAYRNNGLYFGRTLDWDYPYPAKVVITPRKFRLGYNRDFGLCGKGIIGMAYVKNGYPLYFDGANEDGLCMAGLNFVGNAAYAQQGLKEGEVPQYELIPYVLSCCSSVNQAKELLLSTTITDEAFSDELPAASLHWLVADAEQSFTLEITCDGMNIYDNPHSVLTNNPPFPRQLENLEKYKNLTAKERDAEALQDKEFFTRGTGAVGLPGDWSSMSRFVRGVFALFESKQAQISDNVNQFFRIMGAVSVPKGCMIAQSGFEYTLYTCCIDAQRGVYYYSTYCNHRICAVDMHKKGFDGEDLMEFSLKCSEDVFFHN